MATNSTNFYSASPDAADRLAAAKRAVPISRITDYGLWARDALRLHALDQDSDQSWEALAEAIGDEHLEQAGVHSQAGRRAMARLEREQAAAAFNIAQLVLNRDTDTKRRLYARTTTCLEANAGASDCEYRRLKVRNGAGRALFGWEFPVSGAIGSVVMFGGLSGWGASFMRLARTLQAKGFRTILAEGPGQGETRLVSGIYLSRAALSDAMRFVELAAAEGQPVALIGFSFGGLIAAHLAAASAVAALCTNGSPAVIGEIAHPAEREQFAAAFGAKDDELQHLVADFNFDASAEILRCPILSLEGGADPLVAPGTCRSFVGERTDLMTQVVWDDGLHTLYNHAGERDALIAAWLLDCFKKSAGN